MKRLILLILIVLIFIQPVEASEVLSPVRLAEIRIRDEHIEHTIVFDVLGNVIGENTGTDRNVTAPDVKLYGMTILHNHPMITGGSPFFSALDVRFATFNNVQRSIVISPVMIGRYKLYIECTMDRGEALYWPDNIVMHYDKDDTHPESFAVLSKRVSTESIHPIWQDYFSRYWINYECVVLS